MSTGVRDGPVYENDQELGVLLDGDDGILTLYREDNCDAWLRSDTFFELGGRDR